MDIKNFTRKEKLLYKVYELENELDAVNGKAPRHDLEFTGQFAIYDFRCNARDERVDTLEGRIRGLEGTIARTKTEKAKQAQTDEYYQTEEGMARRAALLARKDAEVADWQRYKNESLDVMKDWIKDFLGSHWTVKHMYDEKIEFAIWDADKADFVFGSSIEVWARRKDFWTKGERFETNVGTMGTFDLGDNRVDARARFYIDLGRFLGDQAKLNQLKYMIFGYAADMRERMDSIEKLNAELQNPLGL